MKMTHGTSLIAFNSQARRIMTHHSNLSRLRRKISELILRISREIGSSLRLPYVENGSTALTVPNKEERNVEKSDSVYCLGHCIYLISSEVWHHLSWRVMHVMYHCWVIIQHSHDFDAQWVSKEEQPQIIRGNTEWEWKMRYRALLPWKIVKLFLSSDRGIDDFSGKRKIIFLFLSLRVFRAGSWDIFKERYSLFNTPDLDGLNEISFLKLEPMQF